MRFGHGHRLRLLRFQSGRQLSPSGGQIANPRHRGPYKRPGCLSRGGRLLNTETTRLPSSVQGYVARADNASLGFPRIAPSTKIERMRRSLRFLFLAGVWLFVAGCGSGGPAAGTIFWAQSPHGGSDERGTIGRAALSGSGADTRFIIGGKAPAGVAVSGHYVYWANYGSGTIARAWLDGSHVDQHFITTSEYSTVGLAADREHVYWTYDGIDPNSGWIARADLDGSNVVPHFIKAGDSPLGLAVDARHIYWTHDDLRQNKVGDTFSYAIGRANLDGSGANLRFIAASNAVDGLAVSSQYVFWTNNGEHAIGRANLNGTHVFQRCVTLKALPLENVPEGVAVDGASVYWTNYPADTIGRARSDGSGINERFIALRGVPEGIAIAAAVSNASTGSAACVYSKPPLLLGPWGQTGGPYASGWGQVAPAVVSNGGAAASGTISSIHWTSWGGKVAYGQGLHPEYTPQGGYYPKPLVMEVRASGIRRCKPGGRLVYSLFAVREQVKPGGPMAKKWGLWGGQNMCVGFR